MNDNNLLVTIGIPIVKPEFLYTTIEYCLNQTYNNLQIIIANNAKSESDAINIDEIVNSFKDPRIFYYRHKEQIPMIPNWNSILKHAKGELFSILCDDDIWDTRYIEEMVILSKKYNHINIFHSRVAIINEENVVTRLSPICPEIEDGLDFIYHRLAGYRLQFLSDFIVRTKSIKEIGGFTDLPDGWGSDDVTWFKLAIKNGIAYSNKILFYYRNSEINVSNSHKIKAKLTAANLQHVFLYDFIHSNEIYFKDTFEQIKIKLIKDSISKFKGKSKSYIIKNYLISKYRIPLPLAILIASIYKFWIQNRKN